jgi:hypothetical protein
VADQHDLHTGPIVEAIGAAAGDRTGFASIVTAVNEASGPAGWYPDPAGRYEFRYFNGLRWTQDVSVGGTRFVEPEQAVSFHPGAGPFQPGAGPFPADPFTASRYQPGAGPFPASTYQPGSGPAPRRSRGFAVTAFIIGLGSLLTAWIPFVFVGAAVGVVLAIVFGILGVRAAGRQQGFGRPFAIIGIVCAVAAGGLCVVGFNLTRTVMHEFNKFLEPGRYSADVTCTSTDTLVTARGTITNETDVNRSYTITIEFDAGGRTVTHRTVAVNNVTPAEHRSFTATTFVTATAPVTCSISSVTGPEPFGVTGS